MKKPPRFTLRTTALVAGAVLAATALVAALTVQADPATAADAHVPAALGRLQVTCKYTQSNNDDMLVFPGAIGRSHEHDYFGARNVNAFSTPGSIMGQGTTCARREDESAYWAPSLSIDGQSIRPSAAHVYYEKNTHDPVQAFPPGFRMIVGNARSTSDDTNDPAIFWGCAQSDIPRTTRMPDHCDGRNTLVVWLMFPNCWDGKDSGRASNDLVYANGRNAHCPGDHPVQLPTVRVAIWWDLPDGIRSLAGARLSSGPAGSAHSDFVNGWTEDAMRNMVDCLNRDDRSC